jgi:dienelactone hydrolase
MLADSEFGSHIDSNRIAAAGFSLGGYTMIEIACEVFRCARICALLRYKPHRRHFRQSC